MGKVKHIVLLVLLGTVLSACGDSSTNSRRVPPPGNYYGDPFFGDPYYGGDGCACSTLPQGPRWDLDPYSNPSYSWGGDFYYQLPFQYDPYAYFQGLFQYHGYLGFQGQYYDPALLYQALYEEYLYYVYQSQQSALIMQEIQQYWAMVYSQVYQPYYGYPWGSWPQWMTQQQIDGIYFWIYLNLYYQNQFTMGGQGQYGFFASYNPYMYWYLSYLFYMQYQQWTYDQWLYHSQGLSWLGMPGGAGAGGIYLNFGIGQTWFF
jgi:hypothetical protein